MAKTNHGGTALAVLALLGILTATLTTCISARTIARSTTTTTLRGVSVVRDTIPASEECDQW